VEIQVEELADDEPATTHLPEHRDRDPLGGGEIAECPERSPSHRDQHARLALAEEPRRRRDPPVGRTPYADHLARTAEAALGEGNGETPLGDVVR
jgi:hypothetical protein